MCISTQQRILSRIKIYKTQKKGYNRKTQKNKENSLGKDKKNFLLMNRRTFFLMIHKFDLRIYSFHYTKNTQQHSATLSNTQQHSATLSNTQQHSATLSNTQRWLLSAREQWHRVHWTT